MSTSLPRLIPAMMLSACFGLAVPVYADVLVLDSNGNYVDASFVKTQKTPYAASAISENLEEEGEPFFDPNGVVAKDAGLVENPSSYYNAILEETNALALEVEPNSETLDLASVPRLEKEGTSLEVAPTGDLVFASIVKSESTISEVTDPISQGSLTPVTLKAMPSLDLVNKTEFVEGNENSRQTSFDNIIHSEVEKYENIDIAFVKSVISAESNFNVTALSPKGAMGLMQIMPDTAKRYNVVNPFSPEQNIRAGTAELSRLMEVYRNPSLALAAYNAGEGAVEQYDGVPPFSETQQYIVRVLTKTFQARERLLANEAASSEKIIKDDETVETNPLSRPLVVQTFNY